MSVRTYYKVNLNRASLSLRSAEALVQGITKSQYGHEPPQWKMAPDGSYGLLRAHWLDGRAGGPAKADYEKLGHVTEITDLESAALVASWETTDHR